MEPSHAERPTRDSFLPQNRMEKRACTLVIFDGTLVPNEGHVGIQYIYNIYIYIYIQQRNKRQVHLRQRTLITAWFTQSEGSLPPRNMRHKDILEIMSWRMRYSTRPTGNTLRNPVVGLLFAKDLGTWTFVQILRAKTE